MYPTVTAAMRRRGLVLCTIGLAVVALHVATLSLLGPAWFDPEGPPAAAPRMRVRSVVLSPPLVALVPPLPTLATPEREPMPRSRAANAPSARAARASAADAADAGRSVDPSLPRVAPSPPQAEAEEAVATNVVEIPVYATRLPPPGQWRYRLQRGLVAGNAELRWAPQGDARYELHLQGQVAGVTLLDWASQGLLDAAGLAPERFAVRRRGRDAQAANFQREAGKISFSGPTHELALLPGAQDRLSWMVQLPAVVAAAPGRFGPGASVVLFVAGARGDADVWTFVVQGAELLGGTPALKLVREPRRLYGVRVEVWLDPAEHYLPLRAVQTPSGGGAALELQREPEPR